jgi:hypothetical protein
VKTQREDLECLTAEKWKDNFEKDYREIVYDVELAQRMVHSGLLMYWSHECRRNLVEKKRTGLNWLMVGSCGNKQQEIT